MWSHVKSVKIPARKGCNLFIFIQIIFSESKEPSRFIWNWNFTWNYYCKIYFHLYELNIRSWAKHVNIFKLFKVWFVLHAVQNSDSSVASVPSTAKEKTRLWGYINPPHIHKDFSESQCFARGVLVDPGSSAQCVTQCTDHHTIPKRKKAQKLHTATEL